MAQSNSARDLAPDEILQFTRTFDAPLALVWRLWKEPEHMVRWHGPEGHWLIDCEIDFRVGGKWSRTMSRAADHAHRIYGEYLEIIEQQRLRFTYINAFDQHEMVVTLDFSERDSKTVMQFHQAQFVSVVERDNHGWGWRSGFDLFAEYLAKVVVAEGRIVGQPRRDGVADDIVAARQRQEESAGSKIIDREGRG